MTYLSRQNFIQDNVIAPLLLLAVVTIS